MIVLAAVLAVSLANGEKPFQVLLSPSLRLSQKGSTLSSTVGDLDGDGKLDIVVGESGAMGNSLQVFLQDAADRTRWIQVATPTAHQSWFLLAGDFTGDGLEDIVACDPGSTAFLYPTKGGGMFEKPAAIAASNGSRAVAAGDFDGDGELDIASANWMSQEVSILLGSGDGTLKFLGRIRVSGSPHEIESLDFNGDGVKDLAAKLSGLGIQPLRGKGDGSFNVHAVFSEIATGGNTATGDFNGDGKGDLVGHLGVGISRGDGVFKKTLTLSDVYPFAAADLDGDGNDDLLAIESPNAIRMVPGHCDGTFGPSLYLGTSDLISGGEMYAEDLDGNGRVDLVVNGSSSSTQIFWDLIPPPLIHLTGSGQSSRAAVADLDGSGLPDVFTQPATGTEIVASLDPGHVRPAAPTIKIPVSSPFGFFEVTDLDGDGVPDLAGVDGITNKALVATLGRDGKLRKEISMATGLLPRGLAIGRLVGMSAPDLAVSCAEPDRIWIFGNGGGGVFTDPVQVPTIQDPRGPAIGDLDLDSIGDMVVWNQREVAVQFGTGGGLFTEPSSLDASLSNFHTAVIADLDGDGLPDVATAGSATSSSRLFLGKGSRAFGAPSVFWLLKSSSIALGDLDRDGLLDVVLASASNRSIAVVLNGPQGLGKSGSYPVGIEAGQARLADFDGDGILDLLASGTSGSIIILGRTSTALRFLRGDATADGGLDLADPIRILERLFLGGDSLPCEEAADANDDGQLDLADPIAILGSLFLGQGPLPLPGPRSCGLDPTPDGLSCEKVDSCR
jgi:hypothetical protein